MSTNLKEEVNVISDGETPTMEEIPVSNKKEIPTAAQVEQMKKMKAKNKNIAYNFIEQIHKVMMTMDEHGKGIFSYFIMTGIVDDKDITKEMKSIQKMVELIKKLDFTLFSQLRSIFFKNMFPVVAENQEKIINDELKEREKEMYQQNVMKHGNEFTNSLTDFLSTIKTFTDTITPCLIAFSKWVILNRTKGGIDSCFRTIAGSTESPYMRIRPNTTYTIKEGKISEQEKKKLREYVQRCIGFVEFINAIMGFLAPHRRITLMNYFTRIFPLTLGMIEKLDKKYDPFSYGLTFMALSMKFDQTIDEVGSPEIVEVYSKMNAHYKRRGVKNCLSEGKFEIPKCVSMFMEDQFKRQKRREKEKGKVEV